MDLSWHLVWKCAVLVLTGIALLRLSGRKSIAQMIVATTIIMISIGELIAQGIIEKTWQISSRGTIETNGELGYELQEAAKPVTKRDLEALLNRIGEKRGKDNWN